ncbi:MAG: hypothetical protein ABSH13_06560 [Candidatus Acidiferrum sp.]
MEIVGTVAGVEREIAPGVIGKDRDRVAASLRLDFEFHPPTGQTILVTSYQEPPLKVVRAFAVEGGAALVHLHNVSGGLLGGDRLELAVNVGAHAQVHAPRRLRLCSRMRFTSVKADCWNICRTR